MSRIMWRAVYPLACARIKDRAPCAAAARDRGPPGTGRCANLRRVQGGDTMAAFLFVLFLVIAGLVVARVLASRRSIHVHDGEGRRLLPSADLDAAKVLGFIVGPLLLLIILGTSFRVVPVGHGLVIFNTLTKGFRVARQGITFI